MTDKIKVKLISLPFLTEAGIYVNTHYAEKYAKDAKETIDGIKSRYQIVDFLNEVEEQDWELDADDIKHILNMDFDYIRKQYYATPVTNGSTTKDRNGIT